MRVNRKKSYLSLLIAAFVLMTASGTALAEELDATLTATIKETTCDMKLVGGKGDNTNQTIQVAPSPLDVWTPLADGQAGKATATFKLAIIECPASLTTLKTTIRGTSDSRSPTALANQTAKADGGAEYAALEIARSIATNAPFTINADTDAERLVWTDDEIDKKEVSLTATLRETQSGLMTAGTFRTVATFEFSYE
ncbi:fimbrial protein [Salmonella enterica subsp. enterica serovar Okatie]|nr:fimbrial protein [Salmonella enterica subsp. enterica serovar Okatie]